MVLNFDDEGTVIARAVLGRRPRCWTPRRRLACGALSDPGAVIFEVKHGFAPFREEDCPWSPAVDDLAGQQALMAWYRHAEVGQRWPGADLLRHPTNPANTANTRQ